MINRLGFTFIELIVAISILMVTSISGTVYLNKLAGQQKLDRVKTEIESIIKLSQNYAKVKQKPDGYLNEVLYVKIQKLASGTIEADVNGVGTTYFSKNLTENGLTIVFDPIYFWGGSGKLTTVDGSFFSPDATSQILITLNQDIAQTRVIIVNSLGGLQ